VCLGRGPAPQQGPCSPAPQEGAPHPRRGPAAAHLAGRFFPVHLAAVNTPKLVSAPPTQSRSLPRPETKLRRTRRPARRALALKQVSQRDAAKVVLKEAAAGCLMGAQEQLQGGASAHTPRLLPFAWLAAWCAGCPAACAFERSCAFVQTFYLSGGVIGLAILGFSCLWDGISTEVGATVAIALPVSRACRGARGLAARLLARRETRGRALTPCTAMCRRRVGGWDRGHPNNPLANRPLRTTADLPLVKRTGRLPHPPGRPAQVRAVHRARPTAPPHAGLHRLHRVSTLASRRQAHTHTRTHARTRTRLSLQPPGSTLL
jgi:hypothetical protein